MDTTLYIIIIIGLSIFIISYGGHNNQLLIEYESDYFKNLNSIIILEKKINKINYNINFSKNNFINITQHLNSTDILIPNFIDCFLIEIAPYKIFNIYNIIHQINILNHIMVLFNNKKQNNIELLINTSTNNFTSYGYFYKLNKIISITGIYPIYNNSDEFINITCFIIKKPFWHS